jgi:hypothetical protein
VKAFNDSGYRARRNVSNEIPGRGASGANNVKRSPDIDRAEINLVGTKTKDIQAITKSLRDLGENLRGEPAQRQNKAFVDTQTRTD